MKRKLFKISTALVIGLVFALSAFSQTTEFTYQGKLVESAQPADGNYDFEFALFDALAGGNQIGTTITKTNVPVSEGVFSVKLDFGDQFPGGGRWLEIRVKQTTSGTFTTLNPRQSVASSPYAVKSLNAENANLATTATNATQLGGIGSNQYVLTDDSRMTDARAPTAGSANYIQNSTSQQSSSNFNISGTGTADEFDALTQYKINGNKLIGVDGTNNLFVGINSGTVIDLGYGNSFFGRDAGAVNTNGYANSFFGDKVGTANTVGHNNSFFGRESGIANTTGNFNSFFGSRAGESNTTGDRNSFFGHDAGNANTTGNWNSFFGKDAGNANTTGGFNSFFGSSAGKSNTASSNSFFGSFSGQENTTGNYSAFFGINAGRKNTTGSWNSFFGADSGEQNTTGQSNSFFGKQSGDGNTTGSSNTFLGERAGDSNITGSQNTIIGSIADVGSEDLTNAIAIGAFAQVDTSNSMVLGSINGVNFATADTNVGIGTTAPTERLHIAANSGRILMGDAGCSSGVTAIGFASTLSGCENYAIAGTSNNTYINTPPGGSIFFRQGNTTRVRINSNGTLFLGTISTAGATSLCLNASNEIGICSSSIRYKSNIENFNSGLELIKKLRPVSFSWKDGGMLDLGLVAEEVNAVEPLLATRKDGQVEGVKYDRIGVVLVNAVKEQQAQIERQKGEIQRQNQKTEVLQDQIDKQNEIIKKQTGQLQSQQTEIDELKKRQTEIEGLKELVCSQNKEAKICHPDNQEM